MYAGIGHGCTRMGHNEGAKECQQSTSVASPLAKMTLGQAKAARLGQAWDQNTNHREAALLRCCPQDQMVALNFVSLCCTLSDRAQPQSRLLAGRWARFVDVHGSMSK